MSKNIVICCDGTGNQFGKAETNVMKLCTILQRDPQRQILYYDPGVGTIGSQNMLTRIGKLLTRALGGAIGYGLKENVAEAYHFLERHYEDGDRIFGFGFSRGAYTIRALAAILHMYGLPGPGSENLTPYILNMIYGEGEGDRFRVANKFKKTFARRLNIEFVGVWDTVSSVGWFWNPLSLPHSAENPSILHVRHAVSIDERRAFFRQNLFKRAAGQDLKETWFAGVHSDVGGGYLPEQQGLAQIPFAWMLQEAEACGLLVDAALKAEVLRGGKYAPPDHKAEAHESLTWKWWLLEFVPKFRPPRKSGKWQQPFRVNFFRRRWIDEGAAIHRSVVDRVRDCGYRPANLTNVERHPIEG